MGSEFYFEGRCTGPSVKSLILLPLYRYAFKNLDGLIVNAIEERRFYSRLMDRPETVIRFIPFPSNIDYPQMIEDHAGYVFAAGSSLRDWKTFFLAIEDLKLPSIVVASAKDVECKRVPDNCELYLDIPYEDYKALLRKAKVVVVPLTETRRSTGQSCFLEAMSYGKPVIVADVVGCRDYVVENVNGLYYRPGDVASLKETILRVLGDEDLRRKIAESGLNSVRRSFNRETYSAAVFRFMEELLKAPTAED